jgi:uncharacterized RDD family membrane protein YckC
MSLTATPRQGQLAVDPPASSVDVRAGTLALVQARVELRLSPRPLKGPVEVAADDSAFAIVQVREVRRAERWVFLEVSGAYHAPEPRAVTLTYTIHGLSARQTVTFAPSVPVREAAPQTAPQRHVPFENVEAPRPPATPIAASRAQPFQSETVSGIDAAPPLLRIVAALSDVLCAAAAVAAISFVYLCATVIPLVSACGDDDYPAGSGCATAENWIFYPWFVFVLAGIPLYHLLAAIIGGGFAQRRFGLRIVRHGTALRRDTAEEPRYERPGFWRALLRTVVAYAGVACAGIGYLWIFTNRERRTWHDLCANTVVVRARR